jgi:hypothetical protein
VSSLFKIVARQQASPENSVSEPEPYNLDEMSTSSNRTNDRKPVYAKEELWVSNAWYYVPDIKLNFPGLKSLQLRVPPDRRYMNTFLRKHGKSGEATSR